MMVVTINALLKNSKQKYYVYLLMRVNTPRVAAGSAAAYTPCDRCGEERGRGENSLRSVECRAGVTRGRGVQGIASDAQKQGYQPLGLVLVARSIPASRERVSLLWFHGSHIFTSTFSTHSHLVLTFSVVTHNNYKIDSQ